MAFPTISIQGFISSLLFPDGHSPPPASFVSVPAVSQNKTQNFMLRMIHHHIISLMWDERFQNQIAHVCQYQMMPRKSQIFIFVFLKRIMFVYKMKREHLLETENKTRHSNGTWVSICSNNGEVVSACCMLRQQLVLVKILSSWGGQNSQALLDFCLQGKGWYGLNNNGELLQDFN